MSSFKCIHCEKSYAYIENMNRHIRSVHEKQKFYCDKCNYGFSRLTSLKSHYDTVGGQHNCRVNKIRGRIIKSASTSTTTQAVASATAQPSPKTTTSTTVGATATAQPSHITTTPTQAVASATAQPSHITTTPTTVGATATPQLFPLTSALSAVAAIPSTSGTSSPLTPVASTQTRTTPSPSATSEPYCTACKVHLHQNHWSYHLRTNAHKRNSGMINTINKNNNNNSNYQIKTIKSGFKKRIETLLIENTNEEELRAEVFLKTVQTPLLDIVNNRITKHGSIKWNIELFCEYIKITHKTNNNNNHNIDNDDGFDDEEWHRETKSHQTKMRPAFPSSDVKNEFDEMCSDILAKMSEFQERDSGWTLTKLLHLEININQYKPH